MLQEEHHPRSPQPPARDTLVAAAIRQMAHDLRVHETRRRSAAGAKLDRTEIGLRRRLGRSPTAQELARAGGIDVEDVLDELDRRRRDRA
jgi:DNA-directed RNA polymerase specialized sigma subunit